MSKRSPEAIVVSPSSEVSSAVPAAGARSTESTSVGVPSSTWSMNVTVWSLSAQMLVSVAACLANQMLLKSSVATGVSHQAHLVSVNNSASAARSEEHTSELQSQSNLVCRLLLEKKT